MIGVFNFFLLEENIFEALFIDRFHFFFFVFAQSNIAARPVEAFFKVHSQKHHKHFVVRWYLRLPTSGEGDGEEGRQDNGFDEGHEVHDFLLEEKGRVKEEKGLTLYLYTILQFLSSIFSPLVSYLLLAMV